MATKKNWTDLFKAATLTYEFDNPADSLSDILRLVDELLECDRVALYEYDAANTAFTPRLTEGVPLSDLGRLSSTAEHPVLREAINNHKAGATDPSKNALALPLSPGTVACAPCVSNGQTVGLIFAAKDKKEAFKEAALDLLEVLATRAGEVLTMARQSASQSYIFHKLSLLYQASHAVASTRDRQEAVRQIAAHLLKATSADICEILVFDESNGHPTRFRQRMGKAMEQSLVAINLDALPEYPVHQKVLEDLKPRSISLSPPIGSPEDLTRLQDEEISAAAIFPLTTRNEAIGLVRVIYTLPRHKINEQELELAQAILNIGAVGLQDAIHLETAEDRASQLQVLGEIGREMTSTLDLETALENAMVHTQRLLGAEACVLFLLDQPGEELILKASGGRQMRIRDVAIRLEEGIAGWVARNRKPLVVNDVRTNPLYQSAIDGQTGLLTSSVLCVPLERREEVMGVIEAINHPRGFFNEADQQILSSVASWAAIALDNANLFQRVAEERSRLEATLVETADAVVLTDTHGNISLINQAAGQVFRINPERAAGRPATEIFAGHPLGELMTDQTLSLPVSQEVSTPTERTLYATISEITDVGRVAVMQDITALKQIDRMRSQLLGTAAHDLKNPLNAIRLGADLLNDAPLSDQQRKALSMMERATESMTNLITALLETIRVESTSNLAYEPCQVNDLVRRAIEDLRPLAEAKNHTVAYAQPEEPILIMGDPGRLNSVMTNTLSNAIKFTQPEGRIEISVKEDEEHVTISVKDNGPGIPEEEIDRVFDHLFRGRITVQDPDNPIEGTGLGLALAKTVIEQHGGRIWVESELSEGSKFHFELPREPTPKTGSLQGED
jgi:two-component system NtrC family sensor kinase